MRRSASAAVEARRALLAVARGEQHAELGRDRDHQRAERRRHGFSGTPSSHSTSADQPVASAIGTSGTSARSAAPVDREQRQRDRAAGPAAQRPEAPQRRRQRRVGLGGQHGQARDRGAHARGGSARPRMSSMISLLALQRQQPDPERQRRGPAVGASSTAWEK